MSKLLHYLKISGPTAADWKVETKEFRQGEDELAWYQKQVGGMIQVVPLEGNIIAVCNEEGKIENLPPSVAWMFQGMVHDIMVGNVLVLRSKAPNMVSIQEEDIPKVKRILVPVAR